MKVCAALLETKEPAAHLYHLSVRFKQVGKKTRLHSRILWTDSNPPETLWRAYIMAFSREEFNKRVIQKKVERAINLSGFNKPESTGNPSYVATHGYKSKDEIRRIVSEKVKKFHVDAEIRRRKNAPK